MTNTTDTTPNELRRLSEMAGDPPEVKVSEPAGLGAVVLADDGEPWTKWNDWLWRSRWAPYVDAEWGTFSAVRVLSAGVTGSAVGLP